jgi:polynucleotide 5'-triphosphatase
MEIAAIVNPTPVAPHRSMSNSKPILAASPTLSPGKLPTPPLSIHKHMPHKRKRTDPKPIWAYREHEALDKELQEEQREKSRLQAQAQPQPQAQPRLPPQHAPVALLNSAPLLTDRPTTFGAVPLSGFERPITGNAVVYDEMSRRICDFLWAEVVDNGPLRMYIQQNKGAQVEIEARWGHIKDRNSNMRLHGLHETECVVKPQISETSKFESTMSLDQHKRMNLFLNEETRKSNVANSNRPNVKYEHLKETDQSYDLDQAAFNALHPFLRELIGKSNQRQRIRVTRDSTTGTFIRSMIKVRVANLEISSPMTEWDYRIGINLEVNQDRDVNTLQPVVEKGRSVEDMKRHKDRMSYSWMNAYRIDLTQVTQGQKKNHELELELDADLLIKEAEANKMERPNSFEPLITGMMNNLRVLSRQITQL